jgi:hypothetical protein
LEQELVRSEVAEGLMRADGIVDFFPLAQFASVEKLKLTKLSSVADVITLS